jgi:hypothetical protein
MNDTQMYMLAMCLVVPIGWAMLELLLGSERNR